MIIAIGGGSALLVLCLLCSCACWRCKGLRQRVSRRHRMFVDEEEMDGMPPQIVGTTGEHGLGPEIFSIGDDYEDEDDESIVLRATQEVAEDSGFNFVDPVGSDVSSRPVFGGRRDS